jgi:hypothetical protein
MGNPNPWSDTPEELEATAKSDNTQKVVNLKFQEGKNVVRIVGSYVHYDEHWFNKIKRTAICPGKGCPVCSHPDREKFLARAKALRESGKEVEAKDLFRKTFQTYDPKLKYAVNVIDRKDGQVKIWRFSRTMKEKIMNIAGEYGDPTGYDLAVTRTGKDLDTEYTVMPARNSEALTAEEKQLKVFPLKTILRPTSVERIQSYLKGIVPQKRVEPASEELGNSAPVLPTDIGKTPDYLEEPDLSTLGDEDII